MLCNKRRKPTDKFCCVYEPLFPIIKVPNVVPDILHFFLRVCDTFVNLFIVELRRVDGIKKATTKIKDLKKFINVKIYE